MGRVYLFNEQPQEELPFVDIPLMTQNDATPLSLLIQMDSADLSPHSRERLRVVEGNQLLPLEVLRSNRGIDPEFQLELAGEIARDLPGWVDRLSWKGYPSYEQLSGVCDLIWRFFVRSDQQRGGVVSGRQLAFRIASLGKGESIKNSVLRQLAKQENPDADEAVESHLDFLRYWASFHFPRYLMSAA